MPIVEITSWEATNAYIADPSIFKPVVEGITKSDGCIGIHSGLVEEDRKRFHSFIVWETLEHHKALTSQPSFAEWLKIIQSVKVGESKTSHVDFVKDFTPALTAPTTEILWMTLNEGKTKEDLYNILSTMATKIDAGNAKYAPVTWGPTLEDSNTFYLTIGWDSTKVRLLSL
ncbi:hypothetical protein CVT25_001034 [Psilocybe cyanescens]|uniref:ABM domain-containing protein n=1 Tax=Psilocybe cyanescens TaxID=93625 RepID=A0A409XX47_PSICY|nr:hypothetical protein CVT25_001034 [Psilocybe cyanescens]